MRECANLLDTVAANHQQTQQQINVIAEAVISQQQQINLVSTAVDRLTDVQSQVLQILARLRRRDGNGEGK